jgi:hypothetical protein
VPRSLNWLLVLLLFGAFGAVVVRALLARAEAGEDLPPYSVYSRGADGLADTARFLKRLGWEPVAVTRPVPLRTAGPPRLLILAEPGGGSPLPGAGDDLSDAEAHALLRWVEQGNTLLLCGRHTTALHHALDVVVTRGTDDEEEAVTLGKPNDYTRDVSGLVVEGRSTVRAAEGGQPLWQVAGQPGALLVGHGQGRVLVVADPSLLTPRGLRRADNVLFLYQVAALHAQDGRVYFDEYHHGLHSGGGFWDYLRYHQQHGLLLLVLIAAAVAGWSVAVRLGPAVPRPRAVHADAVDYASAVARIYQRAGVQRLLARGLARGFLAALTRHLHLRRAALPAEVLAAWRQHHPAASADRLQALLRGTAQLRRGEAPGRQLLAWARAFDQFLAEVGRVR